MSESTRQTLATKTQFDKATTTEPDKGLELGLQSSDSDSLPSDYDDFEEYIPTEIPRWECLYDIFIEIKYFDEEITPYLYIIRKQNNSYKRAKRYIQGFIDMASENEIYAVYELLKVHKMMTQNKHN